MTVQDLQLCSTCHQIYSGDCLGSATLFNLSPNTFLVTVRIYNSVQFVTKYISVDCSGSATLFNLSPNIFLVTVQDLQLCSICHLIYSGDCSGSATLFNLSPKIFWWLFRICNSVMITERKFTRKEYYLAFTNERSFGVTK